MATYPPPAKREKKPSATTTAASLADDVLFEIFIRLPSLATLVRAAHTCRAWRRAVASSRDFRRRFRETHPDPLLGLFFDPPGGAVQTTPAAALLPAFPSFVPARDADRDQAAAVRGGDFFLTSLQERRPGGWDIHDCRGGYILVGNSGLKAMAVLNPLARRSERYFTIDSGHGHVGFQQVSASRLCCSEEPDQVALDARFLCFEEELTNTKSFRVVIVARDKCSSRVRATVFSSDTGEWSVRPWVDVPLPLIHVPLLHYKLRILNSNMQANGMLYWAYSNLSHMVTLDMATMDFSVTELPRRVDVKDRACSFVVGEAVDGTPCVVYAFKFRVRLFLQRTDDDGVKRWSRDKITSIDTQLDEVPGQELKNRYSHVQVVAVRDGFAYLTTSVSRYHCATTTPSWVLSLCLETMKLDKLFQRPYGCCVRPYVMPWPPSLILWLFRTRRSMAHELCSGTMKKRRK